VAAAVRVGAAGAGQVQVSLLGGRCSPSCCCSTVRAAADRLLVCMQRHDAVRGSVTAHLNPLHLIRRVLLSWCCTTAQGAGLVC
jgi:hypothetical protein